MLVNLHKGTCPSTLVCVTEMRKKPSESWRKPQKKAEASSFLNTSH